VPIRAEREEFMKRAGLLLVLSLVVVSCATMQPQGPELLSRAAKAMGGADALSGVKTVAMKGTARQWEPEQSMVPGGEMRFANEATFDAVTDVATGASRIDWVRKFEYPAPRTFTFSEIVTPDAGYVAGIDSNGRTKQSLESNPPAHSMSGLRLATSQRELRRGSSLLVLEMLKNPDRLAAAAPVPIGGVPIPRSTTGRAPRRSPSCSIRRRRCRPAFARSTTTTSGVTSPTTWRWRTGRRSTACKSR